MGIERYALPGVRAAARGNGQRNAPRLPAPRSYTERPMSFGEAFRLRQERAQAASQARMARARAIAARRAAGNVAAPEVTAARAAQPDDVAAPAGDAAQAAAGTVAVPETTEVTGPAIPRGFTPSRRPVNGSALLHHLRAFFNRYAWFQSESQLVTVTLWAVATHVRDASGAIIFPEFAHLGFFSNEPGCGKTRCLQLLQMVCANAPNIPIEPSEAAVALMLGREHRVLLLDEGDVLFGAGKRKSAIRAILNSSYKQGGTWPRVRGGALDDVKVDGGACAGGFLDVVEKGTGNTLEALLQRFLKMRMCKPPAGTVIRKPREVLQNHPETGAPITGVDVAARLKEKLTEWAAQECDALAGLVPEMPPGVELRQEELWTALLAVAERAGPEWQQAAWEACADISLYGGTPDGAEDDMALLADITSDWE